MTQTPPLEIRVRGQVQGVGFRPFVWQLAQRFALSGEVLNDAEGVLIRIASGDVPALLAALRAEAPPLARIDAVEVTAGPDWAGRAFDGFAIAASGAAGADTRVTPDAATCADCAAESLADTGRRAGYAFTNCTHCGPRFSIVRALPYDRARTTMAGFDLCAECAAEYGDPRDRRFHAQPIACPACGPRIWLERAGDERPLEEGVIEAAAARLRAGEVLAIKGVGGFHLACDALNAQAVQTLRARKHRPAKPFALMGDWTMIRAHCDVAAGEEDLLHDPAAPIVVMAARTLPDGIAPGQRHLGWMLPYTPLHQMLIRAFGGPLVMTSGNLSGAPQAIDNAEARRDLAGFADGFLMHDRPIARRLDDSVERITGGARMVLRRARGRVPDTLPLPQGFGAAPQVIAYGGQMKAAICLTKNGQALLGHHLGELDAPLTWEAFCQAEADYTALFDHRPAVVACDLHPDFRASAHAQARGAQDGIAVAEVQHHHAHLAACLGENLWPLEGGKVAGIVLDGLGLGPDGTVWGGEVLLGDYRDYTRMAWLTPAPLIGGDRAQAEPWRNALVRLDAAGLGEWADALFPDAPRGLARMAAEKGLNAPLSSSAGRLFDAVAACLGLCPMGQSYEGEAAMRLEALAEFGPAQAEEEVGYGFGRRNGEITTAALFASIHRDLAKGTAPALISARFHRGLARGFAFEAKALVEAGAARAVALTGGCFQNAFLLREVCAVLGDVPVLLHTKTPANDGGLALGQALVAAAAAMEGRLPPAP